MHRRITFQGDSAAVSGLAAEIAPLEGVIALAHHRHGSAKPPGDVLLRNHGRVSANYVVLMALGGVIAASGFLLESVTQAIAFVGAAIIAPAFEPVAKLAQGLVLRQAKVCGRALVSMAVGYAVLGATAYLHRKPLS
jgi:hypothetical protein